MRFCGNDRHVSITEGISEAFWPISYNQSTLEGLCGFLKHVYSP